MTLPCPLCHLMHGSVFPMSCLVAADYLTFLQHSGMFGNGCYTQLAAVAMAALFFIESLKGDGLSSRTMSVL